MGVVVDAGVGQGRGLIRLRLFLLAVRRRLLLEDVLWYLACRFGVGKFSYGAGQTLWRGEFGAGRATSKLCVKRLTMLNAISN
jgi:hypothetical protein